MDTTTDGVSLRPDPDYAVLDGEDAEWQYFEQVSKSCSLLVKWQEGREQVGDGQDAEYSFETAHLRAMLDRLLYTLGVLRIKHAFRSPDDLLRIDLTDSGFPNRHEISTMQVDLLAREKILREMPSEQSLKRQILDLLFARKEEPAEHLRMLATRTYLTLLDEKKLFLPFVPGPLIAWSESSGKDKRGFATGWACYSVEKNAPYTYMMIFEQGTDRPSLLSKKGQQDLAELSNIIREEGSRVPPLLVLADSIDERATHIHPKLIKRIRIGPFYSRQLLEQSAPEALDPTEKALLELLRTYGAQNDFILMCSEEIIFSHSQYQGTRFLLPTKMRQLFYVPSGDPEAYKTGVSRLYHYALMPYRILQNLTQSDMEKLPKLARCAKIGYDQQERIHEVS